MLRERIQSGNWLTGQRLRHYPVLFLILFVLMGTWMVVAGPPGRDGFSGQPLGTDFLSFWSASQLLRQGRPEAAYDHAALHAIQQSVAGPDSPLYTWLYPPMAFLVVAPLAALPYLPALTVWLVATLAAYLPALWRFLPDRRALVPMLAFPPVFVTLGHGQNAFLSAALLGWGLVLLPKRPFWAGLLMGALIYKPHLGLLLPVAFLAAGSWRAVLGATLSVLALAAASYLLFGPETWAAFLAKSDYSRQVLEQGMVDWRKMIGGFAAARLLGAGIGLSWAIQAAVTLAAALAVWRVWRGPAPHAVKAAALAAGALLATPFALDYDATLLGLALAALVADGCRRGFGPWQVTALAAAWVLPLAWRPLAMATDIPLGPVTVALVLWVAVRRARA